MGDLSSAVGLALFERINRQFVQSLCAEALLALSAAGNGRLIQVRVLVEKLRSKFTL
jgi:hypothetical protein